MVAIRVQSAVWLAVVVLSLVVGCQLGIGAQPAPTPMPPATPLPPQAPAMGTTDGDQKIIDGYLHVMYTPPCVHTIGDSVAPIILTDLRSGSYILLNRNGTIKSSSKPKDKTDEGKAALEALLKDSALVKQIVARPACPEQVYMPEVRQQDGWPDAFAEDIGDPPMPKVAMGTWPQFAESPPPYGYPGWRGAYCWPVSGGNRECDDTAAWKGFGSAEALEPGRFYVTVLGDDANPGRVSRVRVFPAQERRSGRGRELHLGAEVHRAVATSGETLEKFMIPRLPAGDYMLIASYESPLGEVEYGFKVEVR